MRADGPVVQVLFTDYKVEIAPCFSAQGGGYLICDTKNGGRWKWDHPAAQMTSLTESNKATSGNTKRLNKMLKVWRNECSVPIRSLALEILTMRFLAQYEHAAKSSTYFDWMVRDFFAYLKVQRYGTVSTAGTAEVLSLGDAWFTKAESAHTRAVKACAYESATNPDEAFAEWKKIFGAMFKG
jgi:hypothetical protein